MSSTNEIRQIAYKECHISYGHRVVNHESKCANLHGHNASIWLGISGTLDSVGRIIDFGEIKSLFGTWLDENWDHRMLIFKDDPMAKELVALDKTVVLLPFNPTAENFARYLMHEVQAQVTKGKKPLWQLSEVTFYETPNCKVTLTMNGNWMSVERLNHA